MVHAKIEIEIPLPNGGYDYWTVEFSGKPYSENDSIGSYEYWGSKEYDEQPDYIAIDDIGWDKSLYTKEQNAIIDNYLNENLSEVEDALIKKVDF